MQNLLRLQRITKVNMPKQQNLRLKELIQKSIIMQVLTKLLVYGINSRHQGPIITQRKRMVVLRKMMGQKRLKPL